MGKFPAAGGIYSASTFFTLTRILDSCDPSMDLIYLKEIVDGELSQHWDYPDCTAPLLL